jgi:DNA-binding NarL/FixJ family response regulator
VAAASEKPLPYGANREAISGDPPASTLRSTRPPLQKKETHAVFIVAANRLLRDLLCEQVAASPEFRLAGSETAAGPSALEIVTTGEATIVVVWNSGSSIPKQLLDQIETFQAASSQARIVLIGMPAEESIFLASVRAGVAGYVLDDAPMEEVLGALQMVARGDAVCPGRLLAALFRWAARQPEGPYPAGGCDPFGLSRRERQLIPLVAQGLTNKEIAAQLCLSEQTVKNHLRRMMRKAGADNRLAMVQRCQPAPAAGA